jgi:hypothetical protein
VPPVQRLPAGAPQHGHGCLTASSAVTGTLTDVKYFGAHPQVRLIRLTRLLCTRLKGLATPCSARFFRPRGPDTPPMHIDRITDTSGFPQPNADWWSVDLEDGEPAGRAWVSESTMASDAEVLEELERMSIRLHHAFGAQLRSRVGLEVRIERPDDDLS